MTSLSVVVPATDAPATLERCRRAIRAAVDPPEEVIVIDGPAELSASAARNLGARRARGDVVVFVDADVEVHRDAFRRMRAAFGAEPSITALYGSYDDTPGSGRTVSSFRNLLHHHVHHVSAGPADTFWSGLGAIRRSQFLEVGGFDESRFPHPSIEDIELGDRVRDRGGTIVLDPSIQGTHLKIWTLRSMLWTDFARRGVPWVALQVRNRRASDALNCGWRHRFSAMAWATGGAATAAGAPVLVLLMLGVLLSLNGSFYRLLLRRQGVLRGTLGVGLHGLHHLTAIAAVPVGIAAGLWTSSRSTPPSPAVASVSGDGGLRP